MKRWLIERLGGYADLETALRAVDKQDVIAYAIELVRDMSLPDKSKWLTLAVKRHFNTIGSEDILRVVDSGAWLWEGKPLRQEQVQLLKAEAAQYEQTFLWKVIQSELKYQANKRMFITSEGDMDLVAGKLLVYYIDIVKTKIADIAKKK